MVGANSALRLKPLGSQGMLPLNYKLNAYGNSLMVAKDGGQKRLVPILVQVS